MKFCNLFLLFILIAFLTTGCAKIMGTGQSNAPLPSMLMPINKPVNIQKIWSVSAGTNNHAQYLNLTMTAHGPLIVTADPTGNVIALNQKTGKIVWITPIHHPLISGPSDGDGLIVVGDASATVYGLDAITGKIRWHTVLSNQMTAPPVIDHQKIIIKTLDNVLWVLNTADGAPIWQYKNPDAQAPVMILSKSSRPKIVDNTVITAYPDGRLSACHLSNGRLLWQTQIAVSAGVSDVEQMIDTAADLEVSGNMIYAVTYQGQLVAVDIHTGKILWQQALSSYAGLAVSHDLVYVTDTEAILWAFNKVSGALVFKQSDLKYRQLTAPVLMKNYLILADGQGYLHVLQASNGNIVGRALIQDKIPVITPATVINNAVYVLNINGLMSKFLL